MKTKKVLTTLLIIVGLLVGAAYMSSRNSKSTTTVDTTSKSDAQVSSLKEFFNANLAVLSGPKASLGGKFYVTKIDVGEGKGVVYYEDGHNAYVADFTYSLDGTGAGNIETFTTRK